MAKVLKCADLLKGLVYSQSIYHKYVDLLQVAYYWRKKRLWTCKEKSASFNQYIRIGRFSQIQEQVCTPNHNHYSFVHTEPHLSSLRHWKWMEDRRSNTPVLSGSCLHNCIQWRSAASKSPDWYSRCASSANPWKESIRLVGSGAPSQPKGGEGETTC